jgi:ribulose 1,5-bisphosphate synthetase/thiazole synthase
MVVMDDFLKAVPLLPNTPSSQVSAVSSQANRAISDFVHCVQGEPIKVLELLTLDDVLTKKATSELRAALFKVYGQHCTWVVPVDPTQISATVIAAKKVPIKGKAKVAPSAAKKK